MSRSRVEFEPRQKVVLGGFGPMSTLEEFEGAEGVIEELGGASKMGRSVCVRLCDGTGRTVTTRVQFCTAR